MTANDGQTWANGLPLMAGPLFMGLYQPSPETVFFWEGLESGELRLRWCAACKAAHHPKRIVCQYCGNTELDYVAAKGTGSVYSFSVVHRAAAPQFAASVPYVVGIVQLDEGVCLITRFVDFDERVKIGAPVVLELRVLEDGIRLPVFKVAAS